MPPAQNSQDRLLVGGGPVLCSRSAGAEQYDIFLSGLFYRQSAEQLFQPAMPL